MKFSFHIARFVAIQEVAEAIAHPKTDMDHPTISALVDWQRSICNATEATSLLAAIEAGSVVPSCDEEAEIFNTVRSRINEELEETFENIS